MRPRTSDQPNYFPPPDLCTGEPLIEMTQVVKIFKTPAGNFTALNGITACFYPGEFVSVVGKSGSGKSTLVNMITGIDHPTSGSVRVGGVDIHRLSENDISIWRGKNLGIVFQFFQLLPTLTLLENVMLPMYLSGLHPPSEREKRALDLLRMVGLEGFEDKLPGAVSGGQQQSAAIARALANDPPIIVADEPTGNLDSRTAEEIFNLFAGLIEQGKSILMVTHDFSLARRTTRTLLISDGELINPWVAHALPQLNYSQMLWLTHHLQPRSLPAGASIPVPQQGEEWLLLVTAGNLHVLSNSGNAHANSFVVSSGEYLCAQDLQANGWVYARLIAGMETSPLEYYWVEDAEYARWLEQNPTVRAALQQSAQKRALTWAGQSPERESR